MNNTKNSFLACLLFLGAMSSVFGQLTIQGNVLRQSDQSPISYVNIGVLNSSFGTISNSDGSYSIKIPASHLDETLFFSAIGYETKSLAIDSFSRNTTIDIYLQEKDFLLDEVVISAALKKEKRAWLGNLKRNIMVQGTMQLDSVSAGGAIALLIEKEAAADLKFINEARLFISKNTEPEFKVRVRFMEVDKANNNLPGKDLFNDSFVLTSEIKRGWLTFDLSPYEFEIKEAAFFLVFEWILEDKDRLKLFDNFNEYVRLNPDKIKRDSVSIDGKRMLSTSISTWAPLPMIIFGDSRTKSALEKYKCYSRNNSFAEWKRQLSVLSAKVLVSNTPFKNGSASNKEIVTSDDKAPIKKESLESKIEKWGADFIEHYGLLGMQLSVSSKNNTLFSKGFGYADVENEKKVSPQTRFRIASVSKPITSAAMIKLAAEEKLDLDVDVRTYVPTFPEKKHSITTRQLAGHLGGIRDYYEISTDELFNNPHFKTMTDAIAVFKQDTLMSKPGDQFLYSSYGYNLIGAVIEGAAKQPYLDYMRQHIWEPLSMQSTYGEIADNPVLGQSKSYYPNEEEAMPYDLSYLHAAGGLVSTTEDLLKFGNELLYGDYFSSRFKKALFTSQYTVNQEPTGYGLGWYIGKDMDGRKIWYHVGQSPASGAVLILYPEDDIVISLLANMPILVNSDDGLPLEIQKLAAFIYENE